MGVEFHHTGTRAWRDMPDSVVCDSTHDVLNMLQEHKVDSFSLSVIGDSVCLCDVPAKSLKRESEFLLNHHSICNAI